MKYILHGINFDKEEKDIIYDTDNNKLYIDNKSILGSDEYIKNKYNFSNDLITILRISFGFKCNFKCKYCMQESSCKEEKNTVDIDKLVTTVLSNYPNLQTVGFWGGEGLLYFEQIKEIYTLLENKKDKEQHISYYIVTNGSLFKGEIFTWLKEHEFSITISHDGFNDEYRSVNILNDEEIKNNILEYYKEFPNKVSISCVITNKNYNYQKIKEYFFNKFNVDIPLGDDSIIDVHDSSALNCAMSEEQLQEYCRSTCQYIYNTPLLEEPKTEDSVFKNAFHFLNSINFNDTDIVGKTRCFVAGNDTVTIDLEGNILVCQSHSCDSILHDESAKLGSIFTDTVKVPKAKLTYLRNKQETRCKDCIVKFICRGGCPNESEEYVEYNCMANYYNSLIVLSTAIFLLTGYMLTEVKPYEISD